jgi:L-lactate dehydrogenase (cytochrome)
VKVLAGILARQLSADARGLPGAARARFTDAGRVARCTNVADLRRVARRRVPRAVFDYVDGGAWDELTARRNQSDFGALTICPRALVDVSDVDTSTTVLGQPVDVPIIGAPTGLTGLTHHRGEVAVARALHAAGSIYTLSTSASYSIEELAAASPGPTWFQLYVWRDRGLAAELLARARAAGHLALVLTVDAARAGGRERDVRNGFSIPPRITLRTCLDAVVRPRWTAAFVARPRVVMSNVASYVKDRDAVSLTRFINDQLDPTLTWKDAEWLREAWPGPLAVKGILSPDDARTAIAHGFDAIIVSNHGGRQLDGAPSSVQALPPIVDAVGDDAEVILDGGVRRGTDVLKAVALGARACMTGRALLYGLGAGGDAGAARAVEMLRSELRLAMQLTGCPSLASVDRSLVGRA